MNVLALPWLDVAIAASLVGAIVVSRIPDPRWAYRWAIGFGGAAFASAFLAWLGFYAGVAVESRPQARLFGRTLFALDDLNAPLVPTIALLHFLVALATARTHMRRFSFAWSLASESIRLATFSCREPWPLIALLAIATVPPYIELRNRDRPTRVYTLHMGLYLALLVIGWGSVEMARSAGITTPWWAVLPLMGAILVRSGTVPAHSWVTDWIENASPGIGLLDVIPLAGVYAAVRLVLPIGPGWMLRSIGLVSLFTAVYSAGMATVQRETRRFFAHLFLSHASLVLVGLELHTELSMTGSLCLWFSVIVSLGGFGLTLRALEARFGRLSLTRYHGLYGHSPTLAVGFLLTGLASVGFPMTLGFVSTEILVDSAVGASPYVGIGVVAAAALNGIAVVRAYFLLFTGARHVSTVSLGLGRRERAAITIFAALILGGGLFPQPGVTDRHGAAEEILRDRRERRERARAGAAGSVPAPAEDPDDPPDDVSSP